MVQDHVCMFRGAFRFIYNCNKQIHLFFIHFPSVSFQFAENNGPRLLSHFEKVDNEGDNDYDQENGDGDEHATHNLL